MPVSARYLENEEIDGGETRTSSRPKDHLERIMEGAELQSMVSATLPRGPRLIDLIQMGLTPSSARAVAPTDELRRSINSPSAGTSKAAVSAKVLCSMPGDIVESLAKNFVHKVLPQYPIFPEVVVWDSLESVRSAFAAGRAVQSFQGHALGANGPGSYQFLTTYLVLAISVTLGSARGGHESRCMALSSSLFEEGVQHLRRQPQADDDVAALQTDLLILLYATINPRSANVWVLSGAAMRSCLELGLHRECPGILGLNEDVVELRRRVFWVAYTMDRSICSAIQRPQSIPDAAINTRFPLPFDHGPNIESNLPFLGLVQYHQILSEMTQVHFQGAPLADGATWEDWLSSIEHKLRSWYEQSLRESGKSDMTEFTLARGLTTLHRPSPRVPIPSQRSLLLAFEAASSSAQSHRDHIQSGFFRRPWLSAHHTLEGAVIVLFCLRHAGDAITQKFSTSSVFERTKVFTANFLAIASQGWPEVSSYAAIYERLLGTLLGAVFVSGKVNTHNFGPAQDEELTRLLYPGPAQLEKLRLGSGYGGDMSIFDASFFDLEHDFFDFEGAEDAFAAQADVTAGTELLDHAFGVDDFAFAI
ncbi:hypothetical protein LTR85_006103 [Meristemomyces frigidus]|nr:hypothetical protein LTR85_006103 [Meristemomyces frigidus]